MRGINPSVKKIMEEIRSGNRGPITEGLPAGSQVDDAVVGPMSGSKPSMGASGGGQGGMSGIKPNMPMNTAAKAAGKGLAQMATSAANQAMDQRAQNDPTMMDQQQAAVAAKQPQPPKDSPQDAVKKDQVLDDAAAAMDKDNDGQNDFGPDEQGEQPPYQNPNPIQQPGQGRPFGEQAVDFVVGLTEAENSKLATLVAPSYKEAPGDLILAKDALRAVGEAIAEGLLPAEAGLKALRARFDESMSRVMVEFVGIAAGTEALFEEKGEVSEALGKTLAAGALGSLLAAGGLKAGQDIVTEPGTKRRQPETEQPTTIKGKDGMNIVTLAGTMTPKRKSLGGRGQDRSKSQNDLRMALARTKRGKWDAKEAISFLRGRYYMPTETKKTLAQLFTNGGVSEAEQPSPGVANPDVADDHNEDDDKAAAIKRGKKLADMGGYDKGAPSRMTSDVTDTSGEKHKEVHGGVLTSEQHDDILDGIFD